MRFVVFGAGGIGGVVGGRLAQHDHDVALIARGAHRDAIRDHGLTIEDPAGSEGLHLPVAGSPAALGITANDVVLLAMKSHDTAAAVRDLAAVAPPSTPVFCLQNGVENERVTLRSFANVYGCAVLCPTGFLQPGVVQAYSAPTTGIFDVGCFPTGSDDVARAVAGAIDASAMKSIARDDIMRWKYRKLITNLGNAIEAVCGPVARGGELSELVSAEAESVLDAAGIDRATVAEDMDRRADHLTLHRVGGERRQGGSSWQSLQRGVGAIETDYLNGEIVLLGRLHGVPAPANEALQRLANELAAARRPPGSYTEADVLAMIARSAA
jgi:2-dehydropantoate 2-reductase